MREADVQCFDHFRIIIGVIHVNEIDNDETAGAAQAQLIDDFLDRFEIDADARILEARRGGIAP